jgi:hypothetical protein
MGMMILTDNKSPPDILIVLPLLQGNNNLFYNNLQTYQGLVYQAKNMHIQLQQVFWLGHHSNTRD